MALGVMLALASILLANSLVVAALTFFGTRAAIAVGLTLATVAAFVGARLLGKRGARGE